MNTTTKEKKLKQETVQPVQQPVETTAAQPVQQQTNTNTTATQATAASQSDVPKMQTSGASSDVSGLMTMSGLSDKSKQALGSLVSTGYQPSQAVSAALNELNGIIANQPVAFQSGYMQQLNNVMNTILGRQDFSYDMASDPMYQQYRSQYIQAGKQGMQDTMGQAAALTGGYGNSYAQTAGQQSYDAYLQQLGDRLPELYGMALDAYNAEGDRLATNYGLLSDAYNREYGEYQDMYNRWAAERDYAANHYADERAFDYSQYGDMLGTQMDNRDYYYNMAMQMLDNGQTPSDEILRLAGFTDEDLAEVKGANKKSSSSSSSKKSSSSGGSSNSATANTLGQMANTAANTSALKNLLDEEERKKKLVVPKNLYVTDYLGYR